MFDDLDEKAQPTIKITCTRQEVWYDSAHLVGQEHLVTYPFTAPGVADFIQFLGEKGLIPLPTANSIRTACDRIFSALGPEELQNLADLDVAAAVQRFMNKNPGVLMPASAGVYRSRVQKALEMLRRYNANPVSFKPDAPKAPTSPTNGGQRKSELQRKRNSRIALVDVQAETTVIEQSRQPTTVSAMTLTLPLRPDFVAQFIVPRDLSTREARRLGAYFATVAVDYEPS